MQARLSLRATGAIARFLGVNEKGTVSPKPKWTRDCASDFIC